jgi:hypothetical protein
MLSLRTLAIVITGAGVFAGLPLTGAQACDDDRYLARDCCDAQCGISYSGVVGCNSRVERSEGGSTQAQKKERLGLSAKVQ